MCGLIAVLGALVWQGIAASGVPDPTAAQLAPVAIVTHTGLLVFREGLEAILVIAAITASFVGTNQRYRRPVAVGAGAALLASVVTWFVLVALINAVNAPALVAQAVTGVLAIVVLLVIVNNPTLKTMGLRLNPSHGAWIGHQRPVDSGPFASDRRIVVSEGRIPHATPQNAA